MWRPAATLGGSKSQEEDIGSEEDREAKEREGKPFGKVAFAEDRNTVYKDGTKKRAEGPHYKMVVSSEVQIPWSESDSHKAEACDRTKERSEGWE